MTDEYLMEADCRHGVAWFECKECIQGPECPDCADKDAEIERLRFLLTDIVADLASTEGTHDDVYHVWEQIVRRADGIVADVIRDVSDHGEGWCWDLQLPKDKGHA